MGAERERRNAHRTVPNVAGIRTFTLAALMGALAMHLGGVLLLGVTVAAVALYTAIGYWRSQNDKDLGLTTEIALLAAVLLGAQSLTAPALAGGLAVIVTALLALRRRRRVQLPLWHPRRLRRLPICARGALRIVSLRPIAYPSPRYRGQVRCKTDDVTRLRP